MTLIRLIPALLAWQLCAQQADPALAPIQDVPGLPRVLLIGDPISAGYTLPVRELLKGKANVHRIPTAGAATIHALHSIDGWLGAGKWDVIHFNWGLHDLEFTEFGRHEVEPEVYERNLDTLVKRMRKTGAVLIWASTTPAPEARLEPVRLSTDVIHYNEIASGVMRRYGVRIDDLYSAILPKLGELQMPGSVHFKPEGYRFLAEHAAAEIIKALRRDTTP
jgi:acyl-CoA thioesterase-1